MPHHREEGEGQPTPLKRRKKKKKACTAHAGDKEGQPGVVMGKEKNRQEVTESETRSKDGSGLWCSS